MRKSHASGKAPLKLQRSEHSQSGVQATQPSQQISIKAKQQPLEPQEDICQPLRRTASQQLHTAVVCEVPDLSFADNTECRQLPRQLADELTHAQPEQPDLSAAEAAALAISCSRQASNQTAAGDDDSVHRQCKQAAPHAPVSACSTTNPLADNASGASELQAVRHNWSEGGLSTLSAAEVPNMSAQLAATCQVSGANLQDSMATLPHGSSCLQHSHTTSPDSQAGLADSSDSLHGSSMVSAISNTNSTHSSTMLHDSSINLQQREGNSATHTVCDTVVCDGNSGQLDKNRSLKQHQQQQWQPQVPHGMALLHDNNCRQPLLPAVLPDAQQKQQHYQQLRSSLTGSDGSSISAGSSMTALGSSLRSASSWQPGRREVGFNILQPLQATVSNPAAGHQQTAEPLGQQSQHWLPSNAPICRTRSSGGGAKPGSAVAPGVAARIQAAELAAMGKFDPASWAAAEAEAIKADIEAAAAAAAAARRKQQQDEEDRQRKAGVAARIQAAQQGKKDPSLWAAAEAEAIRAEAAAVAASQQQQEDEERQRKVHSSGDTQAAELAAVVPPCAPVSATADEAAQTKAAAAARQEQQHEDDERWRHAGLTARIHAAQLAAMGRNDPTLWAAAEAEAIQGEAAAAAAAAQQALAAAEQERLRREERVAVAVAAARVSAAHSVASVAGCGVDQLHPGRSPRVLQRRPSNGASERSLSLNCNSTASEQQHSAAVLGRSTGSAAAQTPNSEAAVGGSNNNDFSVQHVDISAVASADGGEAPPDAEATGPGSVSVTEACATSSLDVGAAPKLLQDISLVVTSSLFAVSRGSSPQPYMVAPASALGVPGTTAAGFAAMMQRHVPTMDVAASAGHAPQAEASGSGDAAAGSVDNSVAARLLNSNRPPPLILPKQRQLPSAYDTHEAPASSTAAAADGNTTVELPAQLQRSSTAAVPSTRHSSDCGRGTAAGGARAAVLMRRAVSCSDGPASPTAVGTPQSPLASPNRPAWNSSTRIEHKPDQGAVVSPSCSNDGSCADFFRSRARSSTIDGAAVSPKQQQLSPAGSLNGSPFRRQSLLSPAGSVNGVSPSRVQQQLLSPASSLDGASPHAMQHQQPWNSCVSAVSDSGCTYTNGTSISRSPGQLTSPAAGSRSDAWQLQCSSPGSTAGAIVSGNGAAAGAVQAAAAATAAATATSPKHVTLASKIPKYLESLGQPAADVDQACLSPRLAHKVSPAASPRSKAAGTHPPWNSGTRLHSSSGSGSNSPSQLSPLQSPSCPQPGFKSPQLQSPRSPGMRTANSASKVSRPPWCSATKVSSSVSLRDGVAPATAPYRSDSQRLHSPLRPGSPAGALLHKSKSSHDSRVPASSSVAAGGPELHRNSGNGHVGTDSGRPEQQNMSRLPDCSNGNSTALHSPRNVAHSASSAQGSPTSPRHGRLHHGVHRSEPGSPVSPRDAQIHPASHPLHSVHLCTDGNSTSTLRMPHNEDGCASAGAEAKAVTGPGNGLGLKRLKVPQRSSDVDFLPPEAVVSELSPKSDKHGCLAAAALSRGSSRNSSMSGVAPDHFSISSGGLAAAAAAAGVSRNSSRNSSAAGATEGMYSRASSFGGSLLGEASRSSSMRGYADAGQYNANAAAGVVSSNSSRNSSGAGAPAETPTAITSDLEGQLLWDASRNRSTREYAVIVGEEPPAAAAVGAGDEPGLLSEESNSDAVAVTAMASHVGDSAKQLTAGLADQWQQQDIDESAVRIHSCQESSQLEEQASQQQQHSPGTQQQMQDRTPPRVSAGLEACVCAVSDEQSTSPDEQQQEDEEAIGSCVSSQSQAAAAAAAAESGQSDMLQASSSELLLSSPVASTTAPRQRSNQSSLQLEHSLSGDLESKPEGTQGMQGQQHNIQQQLVQHELRSSPHFMMSLSVSGSPASANNAVAEATGMNAAVHQEQHQSVAADGSNARAAAAASALSGHKRLQQLIPQKPKPRQQQMPARVMLWNAGSPTAPLLSAASSHNFGQKGAASAADKPSVARPSVTASGNSSVSSIAAHGTNQSSSAQHVAPLLRCTSAGNDNIGQMAATAVVQAVARSSSCTMACAPPQQLLPVQSQPMSILRQNSTGGTGSSVIGTSDSNHRNAAVASMIAADTQITSSFKHALLESMRSSRDRGNSGLGFSSEQQEQQERGPRHMRRIASANSALRQRQQLQQQQQQQEAAVTNVVAFSFPRTSSVPAFGGRGCLAPSFNGVAAAMQQRQQHSSYRPPVSGSSSGGSSSGISHAPSTRKAVSNVIDAVPVLRLSRSNENLQRLAAMDDTDPVVAGTHDRMISYSSNRQPAASLSQTWSAGHGFAAATGVSTSSATEQQPQQQQATGVSGDAGSSSSLIQTADAEQPPAAVSAVAKKQQSLLSAQMRRNSRSSVDPAALSAAIDEANAAAGAAKDRLSVTHDDAGAVAVPEQRVRGSKTVAAMLGLHSASLPTSSTLLRLHSPRQLQQPPVLQQQTSRKSRVTWADEEDDSTTNNNNNSSGGGGGGSGNGGTATAAAAAAAPVGTTSPRSPALGFGLNPYYSYEAVAGTAPAAVLGCSLASTVSCSAAAAAGLPPAPSRKGRRSGGGLMRTSKSCMEFSSLQTAAATAPEVVSDANGAAAVSVEAGDSSSSSGGVSSPGGQQRQQQQQRGKVFIEAFATKGSLPTTPLSDRKDSGSRASSGFGARQLSSPVSAPRLDDDTSAAAAEVNQASTVQEGSCSALSNGVVAVPAASRQRLSHSHSAPVPSTLLSCSWHEITPALDDDPHESYDNGSSSGNGSSSKSGAVGGNGSAASAAPAVNRLYSYEGDFYGNAANKTSSSSNTDVNIQQQQQLLLQEAGLSRQCDAAPVVAPQQRSVPAAAVPDNDARSSTSSYFSFLWWRRRPQSAIAAAAAIAPAAVRAHESDGCDASACFDLSDLLLMGQAGISESGRVLRCMVDRLEVPGSSAHISHNS